MPTAKKVQKKKFFDIDIPILKKQEAALAYNIESLNNKSIKEDMTRALKGKSSELVLKIKVDKNIAIASPKKFTVLPFFIKHMLRKRISYVEDSFKTETEESNVIIKPFLITRKPVSRAIRRTLRNSARNWIVDYAKTKKDEALFKDILEGTMQKQLSIRLKKIYPLALCEIRKIEIKGDKKKS